MKVERGTFLFEGGEVKVDRGKIRAYTEEVEVVSWDGVGKRGTLFDIGEIGVSL